MYESPITKYMGDIETQIEKQIQEQETEQITLTVSRAIGYDVDKTELLKALQYDREQYTKGYRDGKSDMLDKVKQAREEIVELDFDFGDFYDHTESIRDMILPIIDKLIAESEG